MRQNKAPWPVRLASVILKRFAKRLSPTIYMHLTENLPHYLYQYLWVGLGSMITGIGINTFLIPHHLLSGGASGLALIFYFIFGWPPGLMTVVINIPIFILAYRLLDRAYVVGAIYGLVVFSTAIDATRFLSTLNLVDDTLLAAICGGVVSGIGIGIVFRHNGSSGGTDIIAAIMKKYYSFNMGLVGFSINVIIMSVAAFLFGFKPAIYTLLSMYVSARLTDNVIEGFNRRKTIIIISDQSQKLADLILKEIHRGVTFLEGEGAFTHQDKKVLFVVVTLTQIGKIKLIATQVDPQAFIIVQDAAEVSGKGFSY